jgi:hemerythrin superfamily protein
MTEPHDAIEVLTRDHRDIEELLHQLDDERDPERLRLLYLRLVGLLSAHEEAERQVVFPAFRAAISVAGNESAARLGEHEEINELLAEMRGLAPDGAGFEKRTTALILELQTHFQTEEESVFPGLRAALGPDELAALGAQVEAAKRRAPAFPEAEVPPVSRPGPAG